MHKWFKVLMIMLAVVVSSVVYGQTADAANTDGVMRSSGKIYVVLAIVLTILAGLIFYVARLDRKISKLEKGEL